MKFTVWRQVDSGNEIESMIADAEFYQHLIAISVGAKVAIILLFILWR